MFSPLETAAVRRLIAMALEEDIGTAVDITSQSIIPEELAGEAVFIARAAGVLAGLPAVALVLEAVDPRLRLQRLVEEGARVRPGDPMAQVSGSLRSLLAAERTALNFLQRLSGIASLTRQYVEAVAGLPVQILDTRKTTPGWRLLEKYAVRCGGGQNHRLGLYDGILIKDNHLAALGHAEEKGRPAMAGLVAKTRESTWSAIPVEIEVDSLPQLDEALACGPDIVLLDNMPPADMHLAVQRRNARNPAVLLEASGGVNLSTVRAIAEAGVDRISVGALTHSAPALDISLELV